MQVRTLYKKLGEEIKKGFGHRKVMIDKTTFKHPLESDGCCILPIHETDMHLYPILNDDGGLSHGDRGEEKYELALVLYGEKKTKPIVIPN
jgi:hypothetical protein